MAFDIETARKNYQTADGINYADLWSQMDREVLYTRAQLLSQIEVLSELYGFLCSFLNDDVAAEGKNRKSGLVVAGVLENYYTCVESALFRIAQSFGNHLDPEKWHADLLEQLEEQPQ